MPSPESSHNRQVKGFVHGVVRGAKSVSRAFVTVRIPTTLKDGHQRLDIVYSGRIIRLKPGWSREHGHRGWPFPLIIMIIFVFFFFFFFIPCLIVLQTCAIMVKTCLKHVLDPVSRLHLLCDFLFVLDLT